MEDPKVEALDLEYEDEVLGDITEPDWDDTCDVCGASPVLPLTGMCGPCSTGEADTVNGNW